jgi:hypothetical protein
MYYPVARQEIRNGSLQHVVDVLFDNQAYQQGDCAMNMSLEMFSARARCQTGPVNDLLNLNNDWSSQSFSQFRQQLVDAIAYHLSLLPLDLPLPILQTCHACRLCACKETAPKPAGPCVSNNSQLSISQHSISALYHLIV